MNMIMKVQVKLKMYMHAIEGGSQTRPTVPGAECIGFWGSPKANEIGTPSFWLLRDGEAGSQGNGP